MPNDDFAMICPYYHKTLGNALFCQGFSCDDSVSKNDCFFKQIFASRKQRNECFKKYCASFGYPDCRIATLNSAFYEEKKNPGGL